MFLRANNLLYDPEKVTYILQPENEPHSVIIMFDNGQTMTFRGAEAAEVWRQCDPDPGWKDDDNR